jgi:hypothetical protein
LVSFRPSLGSSTIGTSGSIYIQDAQLEQGLVATDYLESGATTGKAGVLANLPRIDYTDGSAQLLMEPSRTNLLDHSEYFADVYFGKFNVDVDASDILSPEGKSNSYKVTETTSTSQHAINVSNRPTLTAGSHTHSCFVKANGVNDIVFYNNGTSGAAGVNFDLSAGSYSNLVNSATDASIESYGNGWYRISMTFTAVVGTTGPTIYLRTLSSYAGDGVSGIYVYGMQTEAGSFATSYIPTYGAQDTRAKDVSSITSVSSLIGSTEGTIYLEVAALANDLSERRFALSDGTTNNVVRVGFTNISNRILAVLYNGTNQCILTYNDADITETNKIAFTYAANDFALYVNGESRSTDVSGVTFSAGTLSEIHFNEGDGSDNESYGKFDKVMIFPTRLTNNELSALTTL